MRNVNKESITQTFFDYCGPETTSRLRFILETLVQHLHDFTRETNLTHDEWRQGLEFLQRIGEITSPERNEFILLSDVLGLSSLVDMVNSSVGGTPSSVLGPFHIPGAPELAVGGDLKKDNEGATVIFQGRVLTADGAPIAGAKLEFWQTSENGLYSNQDETKSEFNLRGYMKVGEDGLYRFTSVRPAAYSVPDDGPVGELLHATGREPWRPSHLHIMVSASGFKTLVTELFPYDDPYVDRDAVFGVREELLIEYLEHRDLASLPEGLEIGKETTLPFYTVDFDFILIKD